ncbi:hypothetical protein SK128_023603, partial [Halocaridina rubra]
MTAWQKTSSLCSERSDDSRQSMDSILHRIRKLSMKTNESLWRSYPKTNNREPESFEVVGVRRIVETVRET